MSYAAAFVLVFFFSQAQRRETTTISSKQLAVGNRQLAVVYGIMECYFKFWFLYTKKNNIKKIYKKQLSLMQWSTHIIQAWLSDYISTIIKEKI